MDGWRKQGDIFNQEFPRARSNNYRKPPLGGNPSWQQGVPSWEKRFCTSVGSVSWKKVLETKKFIHLYEHIVKWDDSAGEEAFQNAKNRFYAHTHGLPCNAGLPDPDMYIDEIDWNSEVDPKMMLDLECDTVVPDANTNDDEGVIFGNVFPPSYQNFSPFGWGDSDEDAKKAAETSPDHNANAWDDNNDGVVQGNEWSGVDSTNSNWWEDRGRGDQGWGNNDRNNYWGWNAYDTNNNCYYWDVNTGRREEGGRYMSRYKTTRFHGDGNQRNYARRSNGNGRKSTVARPWKSTYSCTPVSPSPPDRPADGWGF